MACVDIVKDTCEDLTRFMSESSKGHVGKDGVGVQFVISLPHLQYLEAVAQCCAPVQR